MSSVISNLINSKIGLFSTSKNSIKYNIMFEGAKHTDINGQYDINIILKKDDVVIAIEDQSKGFRWLICFLFLTFCKITLHKEKGIIFT